MSKITYDKETRIMNIRLSMAKTVDSDMYDNIIVDYDKKGSIVNIEIMDINLKEFSKSNSFSVVQAKNVRSSEKH